MTAEYQRPSKVSGIKTNHFTMSFDVSKYGSPNCYCRDEDSCPPEGLLDLFPCVGTPISISAPHFYKGMSFLPIFYSSFTWTRFKLTDNHVLKLFFTQLVDPSVGAKFTGLNPNQEKHEFFLDFYQVFIHIETFLFLFHWVFQKWNISQFAGAPVSAMPRVQINFEVVPIEEIPYMKDLQPMYLPLMWFDDGVDMPKKYVNLLKYQLIL